MTPQPDDLNPELIASLKKIITPSDVILNAPLRFEHLGQTLMIHGKTVAQLDTIDDIVIDIIETSARRITPPIAPIQHPSEDANAFEIELESYYSAMDKWFNSNRTRQKEVYHSITKLIEIILTPPPGVNGTEPVSFDWLYQNLQLTWGDYEPVGETGLPDQWWDAPQAEQDKIPIVFRILDAYPLRQNTRHLLKKVQTANMFAGRA